MSKDHELGCPAYDEQPCVCWLSWAPKCPNCGEPANFTEHSAEHVETHGLDCGPYERWTEEWVTCNECGAKTDWDEINRMNPNPEVSA